jgi:hypothetical protein
MFVSDTIGCGVQYRGERRERKPGATDKEETPSLTDARVPQRNHRELRAASPFKQHGDMPGLFAG